MGMEFIFLGTSSGIPTKERNVSGLAIKPSNTRAWILVDCGEGTQHQLLYAPLSLVSLEAIFITHVHGDHCYGLPGLIATAAMAGRKNTLYIISPKEIHEWIQHTVRLTDMHLSYSIEYIDVTELHQRNITLSFDVEAITLSHRVPSYAYKFIQKPNKTKLNTEKLLSHHIPQGHLWGELQKEGTCQLDDGRVIYRQDYQLPTEPPLSIIVGGDNDTPNLLEKSAKDISVLIHEATYTHNVATQVGPGPMHSSAKSVACFAEKKQIPNIVLTHFSARYQNIGDKCASIHDIAEETSKYYSGNFFLANDLDHFQIQRDGLLERIAQQLP